ncbi:MAG TPA: right-handed parallel beta-helix repeat-containing protein [Planctomycetota bacterium]|jgi:parallel beta-helix repeat protein|nr:right-handed parallel beta-helix repeat-containing protein [Planctomycetota bacterium]
MRSTLVAALLSTLASPAAAGTVTVSTAGPITTLQGGLDAAVPGDTVLVLEGIYNGDFDNTKSSLIVRGVGTVVLNGDGTFTGAKRCVFQNFTVNGTSTALHLDADSHGNVLSGLTVTSTGGGTVGVWIQGSRNSLLNSTATATNTAVLVGGAFNNVTSCVAGPTTNDDVFRVNGDRNLLRRCAASGSGDDGFEVNGRAHALVQCTAFGSSAAGFRVGGSGSALSKCAANTNFESGATLEGDGNLLSRSLFGTEGGNAGPGILFDGAAGNLVTGCTVSGNAGGGMDLGSVGGNAQLNHLERNRVLANTGHGILLSSNGATNDNWIERNAVSNNTGDGIRVESDHNVILGNSSSGNGGTALNILGSNNLSLNNKAL